MITFLALAASAALTNAAPSIDGNRETVQMAVEYGDLNLATAGGQRRLDRRIESAARTICGSYDRLDLHARTAFDECRAGVLASAKPQVEIAIAKARQSTAVAAASSLVGGQ
jgi:UrcA family protein